MNWRSLTLGCTVLALATVVAPSLLHAQESNAPGARCKEVLVSADPDFAPFAWYDGASLHGASVAVVTSILQRMGLKFRVVYSGPFPRLLAAAKAGRIDIITELKATPERHDFLRFSELPLFENPSAAYVLADSSIRLRGREALAAYRVGVTRGTAQGGDLDDFIAEHLGVDIGPGIRENFEKLAAGRIDIFISPYYPAEAYLEASGLQAKFRAIKPFLATDSSYVGWSKASPCSARLAEFDQKLAAMKADGELARALDLADREWREHRGDAASASGPIEIPPR